METSQVVPQVNTVAPPSNDVQGAPQISIQPKASDISQNVPLAEQPNLPVINQGAPLASQSSTSDLGLIPSDIVAQLVQSPGQAQDSSTSALVAKEIKPVISETGSVAEGRDKAQQMNQAEVKTKKINEFEMPKEHPLHDLYADLDKQVAAKDVTLQQEMIAERRNQTLEEMEEEAYGWEITSFISNLLVVVSWLLAIAALVYPFIVKSTVPSTGQSPSFIIFTATIMFLLVATILTIWAKIKLLFKLITRLLFVIYLILFILVALKSAGILHSTFAPLDVLLVKLKF